MNEADSADPRSHAGRRGSPWPRVTLLITCVLASLPAASWMATDASSAPAWTWLAACSGWTATGLLASSLFLIVRAPRLDAVFGGLARMYRYHHALGTTAFVVLLVHPLALAAAKLRGSPSAALALLWPTPESVRVLSGWAALLVLMAWIVATVASRMPYRAWLLLHKSSGVVLVLVAWHLMTVLRGRLADVSGIGLLLAGGLAYAHRLLSDDRADRGLRYRIVEVQRRAPGLVDLVLAPVAQALHYDAGQFVYLALLDSPSYRACGELHPYTPTSHPDDAVLRVSIKALGDCTRHIQEVAAGAEALVRGPFGGLFPSGPAQRSQVWVAGGIGVTGFVSRAAMLKPDEPPVDLVYAVPNPDSVYYLDALTELARTRPNLRVHTSYDDRDGLLNCARIVARVGSLANRDIVLAGPLAMVSALESGLRACGVRAAAIHTERGILQ
jgi:predicted ferric reductase